MKNVKVVPHDFRWRDAFEREAEKIAAALRKTVVAIHHIGSTAIPGIFAKPVIDLLIEVRDIAEVDARSSWMEMLDYQVMGEFGIPGRRYFRKNNQAGIRTHQIHAFESGSAQIERHLAFRDFLITYPEEAQKYSALKIKLAEKYPQNINGYMDGKDDFIKETDCKATQWRTKQNFQQLSFSDEG